MQSETNMKFALIHAMACGASLGSPEQQRVALEEIADESAEDNGKTPDEEWLRSYGFDGSSRPIADLVLTRGPLKVTYLSGWNVWIRLPKDGTNWMLLRTDVTTRGQIRLIVAAVGS